MSSYIISGCSYTDMPDSWARQFLNNLDGDYMNHIMCGQIGAGNNLISQAVLVNLLDYKKSFKWNVKNISDIKVIVMWSHPHRIDYLYESESIDNNKFWSRLFKFKKGVRLNRENGGKDYLMTGNNGVLDMGSLKSDNMLYSHPHINYWTSFFKYIHNDKYVWNETLKNIIYLQNILKQKNVKYLFLTYTNFMKDFFGKFKFCEHQENLLDLNNFLFTDKSFGGLREWVMNNTNKWDDGYGNHPHKDSHKEFIDNFFKPHLKELQWLT
tara:strand:+ start:11656 stop:12459 length:804 start_codon:yes stop_codon:yes gene_type:complete